MATTRYATHFVPWNEGAPYEDYWIISDLRDESRPVNERAGRLLQTRDERFARNMLQIMRTQEGWWD